MKLGFAVLLAAYCLLPTNVVAAKDAALDTATVRNGTVFLLGNEIPRRTDNTYFLSIERDTLWLNERFPLYPSYRWEDEKQPTPFTPHEIAYNVIVERARAAADSVRDHGGQLEAILQTAYLVFVNAMQQHDSLIAGVEQPTVGLNTQDGCIRVATKDVQGNPEPFVGYRFSKVPPPSPKEVHARQLANHRIVVHNTFTSLVSTLRGGGTVIIGDGGSRITHFSGEQQYAERIRAALHQGPEQAAAILKADPNLDVWEADEFGKPIQLPGLP